MARLTVSERQILRKKKIITLYMYWMNVLHVVQWFFKLWEKIIEHSIESSSLGRQLYILDIFVNRQIVHQIAYESDVICFDQLRMNRKAFSTLCIMLETRGGLKASKYLQVDEQVAMFLHVIAHHVKNRVVRFRFMRSGDTISKYFHNVLHSIIRLHGELLKRPEPVLENSTDERWKWFKVYAPKTCNSYMCYLVGKALQQMVEFYVMPYVEQMVCVFQMMLDILIVRDFLLHIEANVIISTNGKMEILLEIHKNFLI
ncbi:hypothetical protein CsatA_026255 [Cannabis sativa]